MSGYGATAEEAIISGGCNWACVCGPVLEVALADKTPESAESFEVVIHGQRFKLTVDGLDRIMTRENQPVLDVGQETRAVRNRLGATPWLVSKVAASGTLPVLPSDRATILSVFAYDSKDQRVLEVKVNGSDWAASQDLFESIPPTSKPTGAFIRDFAVLVPTSTEAPLSRPAIESTLAGAAQGAHDHQRSLVAWSGWKGHDGVLGTPVSKVAIEGLESRVGRLPGDYRHFLRPLQNRLAFLRSPTQDVA